MNIYIYIYICVQPRSPILNTGVVAHPLPPGGVSECCTRRFIKTCIDSGCSGLENANTTRRTTCSSTTITLINIIRITIYYLLHTASYLSTQSSSLLAFITLCAGSLIGSQKVACKFSRICMCAAWQQLENVKLILMRMGECEGGATGV